MKLTNEEKDLLASFGAGEWKSTGRTAAERTRLRRYSQNTLKNDKRVNIRITANDLTELQREAVQDGLPYQTLISSVLHKFVNGRLIERPVE
jgi:predicted DNA binding CopG/RHH family protein